MARLSYWMGGHGRNGGHGRIAPPGSASGDLPSHVTSSDSNIPKIWISETVLYIKEQRFQAVILSDNAGCSHTYTCDSLSPRSIIWYRCKMREDAAVVKETWSIVHNTGPGASSLSMPAQDLETPHPYRAEL